MRTAPRSTAFAVALVTVLGVLTGCTAADGGPDVDLDRLGEQVRSGVDDARQSLDDLRSAVEAAGLDESAHAEIDDAVQSASTALDQARQAAAAAAETAGPATDAALADARAALDRAKDSIDAAAADARGTLRTSLEALSAEIARLAERLDQP